MVMHATKFGHLENLAFFANLFSAGFWGVFAER
jgi:hypothetical protein